MSRGCLDGARWRFSTGSAPLGAGVGGGLGPSCACGPGRVGDVAGVAALRGQEPSGAQPGFGRIWAASSKRGPTWSKVGSSLPKSGPKLASGQVWTMRGQIGPRSGEVRRRPSHSHLAASAIPAASVGTSALPSPHSKKKRYIQTYNQADAHRLFHACTFLGGAALCFEAAVARPA